MKKILTTIFLSISILFSFVSCSESNIFESNKDNLFKKNHTITLIVDNQIYNEMTVDDGDVLVINVNPRKDNYIFNGWYTDSSCVVAYDFSKPVISSFKLYADFTLKTKKIELQDINIKAMSSSYEYYKSFGLSLVGFDYDYLEKNGMGLQFNIMYNVKYKKDYDVLFDIGYLGAPKYEISLVNNSMSGYFEENLPTSSSGVNKSYTYNTALYFSKDQQISLIFSTDNVQNIIIFSKINVVIEVIRLK